MLTQRETEIMRWLVKGHTNKEIAAKLQLSPFTVADHFKHIFSKLDVHNRLEAVAKYLRLSHISVNLYID